MVTHQTEKTFGRNKTHNLHKRAKLFWPQMTKSFGEEGQLVFALGKGVPQGVYLPLNRQKKDGRLPRSYLVMKEDETL
ncbi:MAG: hypothetical protein MJK07_01250 [Flavobacteriales bacterium]|nr:hypothetical protein [Flavobacteriales bacterium]